VGWKKKNPKKKFYTGFPQPPMAKNHGKKFPETGKKFPSNGKKFPIADLPKIAHALGLEELGVYETGVYETGVYETGVYETWPGSVENSR